MPQFIQVEDKLINLQFIKCIRLSYGILEVTVPEPGGGEVVHFIREGELLFSSVSKAIA